MRYAIGLLGAILSGTVSADSADQFSRANCFNNESITYNAFVYEWRGVVSHHIDHDNNDQVHYVGDSNPVWCIMSPAPCPSTCYPAFGCLWEPTYKWRHAAIHNFEDGLPIPWLSDRWHVDGVHVWAFWDWTGMPFLLVYNTSADDCNLHFEQFY